MQYLKALPDTRLEGNKRVKVRVHSDSVIYVDRNVYSVHSRLIGEQVEARLAAETVDVWRFILLLVWVQRLYHGLPFPGKFLLLLVASRPVRRCSRHLAASRFHGPVAESALPGEPIWLAVLALG
jgi:hypothetical protein